MMQMDPLEIISKYYKPGSKSYEILVTHCKVVTEKALKIVHRHKELQADARFISEAAMLHDIGIFKTNSPQLYCYGEYPYLCHGFLGSEILVTEGYPEHALVCERHIGVGITSAEVIANNLPLPVRDYVPLSIEEQIICFADTFFSKSNGLTQEKSLEQVRKSILRFGDNHIKRFDEWCRIFN
jgi:uncharacterized protein